MDLLAAMAECPRLACFRDVGAADGDTRSYFRVRFTFDTRSACLCPCMGVPLPNAASFLAFCCVKRWLFIVHAVLLLLADGQSNLQEMQGADGV